MKNRFELALLVVLLSVSSMTHARDWFVRAGSSGDGTKEKPFKDPYQALNEAGPGDTLHVAEGVYHSKLDAGNWVIAIPNLTWLGGYNEDFTKRDPWRWPSQLRFSKEFQGQNSGTLLEGEASHENFTLDGFILDQRERNRYGAEPDSSLANPSRDGPMIRFSSPGIQIRNCVLLNGSEGGIELARGDCRVENNIILNMYGGPCIDLRSHDGKPTVLSGNSILFSWSDSGVGSGGTTAGCGVSFWSCDDHVEVADNIFFGCDNVAVAAGTADRLTLRSNVFWLDGWLHVKVQAKEQTVQVDNSNISDLEDAGLKMCAGNVAINPALKGLESNWMEKFLNRVAGEYSNAKLEELNQISHSVGLPTVTEKKAQAQVCRAMAYDWAAALKIVSSQFKAGAHPILLEVKPFSAQPDPVANSYEHTTWQKLVDDPRALDNKRVEINGALGREYSSFGFKAITEDEYRAFEFHDVEERLGQSPMVYVRKGTKAERALKDLSAWDGNGTPRETHLVRGLAKYDSGSTESRKGTLLVDSITPITVPPAVVDKPRPAGRDWFVRAGSTGDGSREHPFKDPWQALDAATPGDSIHVAEGEYFGKFKSATWKVKTPYLSLLGGYDNQFKTRDPWKQPSRLGYSAGNSSPGSEAYVVGEDDHTGLIFDGFVLDGRDVNALDNHGNLASRFPERELLTVFSPDVIIRNCLLVNAAGPAIQAFGQNTHIENNIILNCNYYSIVISRTTQQPIIIRNNTILFTWHADKEKGSRPGGSAIWTMQGTLFELDNNIIGFAEGQGVASATNPKHLRIINNVFTHNRVANFTDLDKIVVSDKTMDLMKDLGFSDAEGNVVLDPQMTLEKRWWADYNRDGGDSFFARPYEWKEALNLLPHNPECHAGARPVKLEVRLNQ
jgi:hypothetical protein